MSFSQFTLNEVVEKYVEATPEERREGIINLMNMAATAAGVNTMAMLWQVLMVAGGEVKIPEEIEAAYDPTKIWFEKTQTPEGLVYRAGVKE